MSKFQKHSLRRDRLEDHAHALPDGKMTMGMQMKPNANARAGWHTHMYQHDGMVYETDAAYNDGDHVHDAPEFGDITSGPMPVQKHMGIEIPREDSLQREGSRWVVRSVTGHILINEATRYDAIQAYAELDDTTDLKQA